MGVPGQGCGCRGGPPATNGCCEESGRGVRPDTWRMSTPAAPVGHHRRKPRGQAQRGLGLGQPGQPAVTGQPTPEEIHVHWDGVGGEIGKRHRICGRLMHAGHSLISGGSSNTLTCTKAVPRYHS